MPLEEYLFMTLVPMMLMGAAAIFKVRLYESASQNHTGERRADAELKI